MSPKRAAVVKVEKCITTHIGFDISGSIDNMIEFISSTSSFVGASILRSQRYNQIVYLVSKLYKLL